MNIDQQFVLEKMKFGFNSKHINQPMTNEDLERLSWPADEYKKIPEMEWNEWSRKTHWALQVAFSDDTLNMKDKDKITEWRKIFMRIVQNALSKPGNEQIILESAAYHFLEKDLLHHAYDIFGYNNLTEGEQKMIDGFSGFAKQQNSRGCLGTILFAFTIIVILSTVVMLVV